MPPFAISMPSGFEWIAILVVVLIFFGVGRLPQVFESLGKGIKSFRDAQREPPADADRSKEIPSAPARDVKEVGPPKE